MLGAKEAAKIRTDGKTGKAEYIRKLNRGRHKKKKKKKRTEEQKRVDLYFFLLFSLQILHISCFYSYIPHTRKLFLKDVISRSN